MTSLNEVTLELSAHEPALTLAVWKSWYNSTYNNILQLHLSTSHHFTLNCKICSEIVHKGI